METKDMYRRAIIAALDKESDIGILHSITKDFEAKGLEQREAYEVLNAVRDMFIKNHKEDKEDKILELMDFVVGFCHPKNMMNIHDFRGRKL